MKIKLLNTVQGLKPMYDEDYDEKKKLKIGEVYVADIKKARNIDFHRKYFALINLAWEYQPERVIKGYHHNVDHFRKSVEICAGWSETIYSISRKEYIEVPKSIAFDKMDNAAFSNLYDNVKRVLFDTFLLHINEDEFMKNLVNF